MPSSGAGKKLGELHRLLAIATNPHLFADNTIMESVIQMPLAECRAAAEAVRDEIGTVLGAHKFYQFITEMELPAQPGEHEDFMAAIRAQVYIDTGEDDGPITV